MLTRYPLGRLILPAYSPVRTCYGMPASSIPTLDLPKSPPRTTLAKRDERPVGLTHNLCAIFSVPSTLSGRGQTKNSRTHTSRPGCMHPVYGLLQSLTPATGHIIRISRATRTSKPRQPIKAWHAAALAPRARLATNIYLLLRLSRDF